MSEIYTRQSESDPFEAVGPENPLAVTMASSAPPSSTANVTSVASSASSGALLAALSTRLGAIIVNESSATLYLKYGPTASLTSYTYSIAPGAIWDMPYRYVGRIDGIWSAANGNARITELTP